MKNLVNKLNEINKSIEAAIYSFSNKEKLDDDTLIFPQADDLERHIAKLNYEKSEYLKKFNSEIIPDELSEEDKKLVGKITYLKSIFPEELYKCIGCPCLENNYPDCASCIFYEGCNLGVQAYPEECIEADCFRTFGWIKENMIEKDIKNLNIN